MSEKSSGESSVRKEIAIVAGPREWADTRGKLACPRPAQGDDGDVPNSKGALVWRNY
jgi:hypothetical protein